MNQVHSYEIRNVKHLTSPKHFGVDLYTRIPVWSDKCPNQRLIIFGQVSEQVLPCIESADTYLNIFQSLFHAVSYVQCMCLIKILSVFLYQHTVLCSYMYSCVERFLSHVTIFNAERPESWSISSNVIRCFNYSKGSTKVNTVYLCHGYSLFLYVYSQEMEDEINEMTKKHCAIANKHQERLEGYVYMLWIYIYVATYVCYITKTVWL